MILFTSVDVGGSGGGDGDGSFVLVICFFG